MQTFLPYPNFTDSAKSLDYRRLGKQRVEAYQILKALSDPTYGWQNHPAVKMWKGYENALKHYLNMMIFEWIKRGYNNTMKYHVCDSTIVYPSFIGDNRFHASHRSNLLRKDPIYYSKFNWNESHDLPYVWPI